MRDRLDFRTVRLDQGKLTSLEINDLYEKTESILLVVDNENVHQQAGIWTLSIYDMIKSVIPKKLVLPISKFQKLVFHNFIRSEFFDWIVIRIGMLTLDSKRVLNQFMQQNFGPNTENMLIYLQEIAYNDLSFLRAKLADYNYLRNPNYDAYLRSKFSHCVICPENTNEAFDYLLKKHSLFDSICQENRKNLSSSESNTLDRIQSRNIKHGCNKSTIEMCPLEPQLTHRNIISGVNLNTFKSSKISSKNNAAVQGMKELYKTCSDLENVSFHFSTEILKSYSSAKPKEFYNIFDPTLVSDIYGEHSSEFSLFQTKQKRFNDTVGLLETWNAISFFLGQKTVEDFGVSKTDVFSNFLMSQHTKNDSWFYKDIYSKSLLNFTENYFTEIPNKEMPMFFRFKECFEKRFSSSRRTKNAGKMPTEPEPRFFSKITNFMKFIKSLFPEIATSAERSLMSESAFRSDFLTNDANFISMSSNTKNSLMGEYAFESDFVSNDTNFISMSSNTKKSLMNESAFKSDFVSNDTNFISIPLNRRKTYVHSFCDGYDTLQGQFENLFKNISTKISKTKKPTPHKPNFYTHLIPSIVKNTIQNFFMKKFQRNYKKPFLRSKDFSHFTNVLIYSTKKIKTTQSKNFYSTAKIYAECLSMKQKVFQRTLNAIKNQSSGNFFVDTKYPQVIEYLKKQSGKAPLIHLLKNFDSCKHENYTYILFDMIHFKKSDPDFCQNEILAPFYRKDVFQNNDRGSEPVSRDFNGFEKTTNNISNFESPDDPKSLKDKDFHSDKIKKQEPHFTTHGAMASEILPKDSQPTYNPSLEIKSTQKAIPKSSDSIRNNDINSFDENTLSIKNSDQSIITPSVNHPKIQLKPSVVSDDRSVFLPYIKEQIESLKKILHPLKKVYLFHTTQNTHLIAFLTYLTNSKKIYEKPQNNSCVLLKHTYVDTNIAYMFLQHVSYLIFHLFKQEFLFLKHLNINCEYKETATNLYTCTLSFPRIHNDLIACTSEPFCSKADARNCSSLLMFEFLISNWFLDDFMCPSVFKFVYSNVVYYELIYKQFGFFPCVFQSYLSDSKSKSDLSLEPLCVSTNRGFDALLNGNEGSEPEDSRTHDEMSGNKVKLSNSHDIRNGFLLSDKSPFESTGTHNEMSGNINMSSNSGDIKNSFYLGDKDRAKSTGSHNEMSGNINMSSNSGDIKNSFYLGDKDRAKSTGSHNEMAGNINIPSNSHNAKSWFVFVSTFLYEVKKYNRYSESFETPKNDELCENLFDNEKICSHIIEKCAESNSNIKRDLELVKELYDLCFAELSKFDRIHNMNRHGFLWNQDIFENFQHVFEANSNEQERVNNNVSEHLSGHRTLGHLDIHLSLIDEKRDSSSNSDIPSKCMERFSHFDNLERDYTSLKHSDSDIPSKCMVNCSHSNNLSNYSNRLSNTEITHKDSKSLGHSNNLRDDLSNYANCLSNSNKPLECKERFGHSNDQYDNPPKYTDCLSNSDIPHKDFKSLSHSNNLSNNHLSPNLSNFGVNSSKEIIRMNPENLIESKTNKLSYQNEILSLYNIQRDIGFSDIYDSGTLSMIKNAGVDNFILKQKLKKLFIQHTIKEINSAKKLTFNKTFEQKHCVEIPPTTHCDSFCQSEQKVPECLQKLSENIFVYVFDIIEKDSTFTNHIYLKNKLGNQKCECSHLVKKRTLSVGICASKSFEEMVVFEATKMRLLKSFKCSKEMFAKLVYFQSVVFSMFMNKPCSSNEREKNIVYLVVPIKDNDIDFNALQFFDPRSFLIKSVFDEITDSLDSSNSSIEPNKSSVTKYCEKDDEFALQKVSEGKESDTLDVLDNSDSLIESNERFLTKYCETNDESTLQRFSKRKESDTSNVSDNCNSLIESDESFLTEDCENNDVSTLRGAPKSILETNLLYNPFNKFYYSYYSRTPLSIHEKTTFTDFNQTYKDYFESRYEVRLKGSITDSLFIAKVFDFDFDKDQKTLCSQQCALKDILQNETGLLGGFSKDHSYNLFSKNETEPYSKDISGHRLLINNDTFSSNSEDKPECLQNNHTLNKNTCQTFDTAEKTKTQKNTHLTKCQKNTNLTKCQKNTNLTKCQENTHLTMSKKDTNLTKCRKNTPLSDDKAFVDSFYGNYFEKSLFIKHVESCFENNLLNIAQCKYLSDVLDLNMDTRLQELQEAFFMNKEDVNDASHILNDLESQLHILEDLKKIENTHFQSLEAGNTHSNDNHSQSVKGYDSQRILNEKIENTHFQSLETGNTHLNDNHFKYDRTACDSQRIPENVHGTTDSLEHFGISEDHFAFEKIDSNSIFTKNTLNSNIQEKPASERDINSIIESISTDSRSVKIQDSGSFSEFKRITSSDGSFAKNKNLFSCINKTRKIAKNKTQTDSANHKQFAESELTNNNQYAEVSAITTDHNQFAESSAITTNHNQFTESSAISANQDNRFAEVSAVETNHNQFAEASAVETNHNQFAEASAITANHNQFTESSAMETNHNQFAEVCAAETNLDENTKNVLSSEVIQITALEKAFCNDLKYFPMCLHYFITASLAFELKNKLNLQITTQNTLKCLTPKFISHSNYERLEFLGDSVLKLCIAKYVLLNENTFYKMIQRKDSIIANSSLFHIAMKKGIPSFCSFNLFSKKQFIPPNIFILTQSLNLNFEKIFEYYKCKHTFLYQPIKPKHNIKDTGDANYYIKTYSDILESFIGATFVERGFLEAEKFIHTSGISKVSDFDILDIKKQEFANKNTFSDTKTEGVKVISDSYNDTKYCSKRISKNTSKNSLDSERISKITSKKPFDSNEISKNNHENPFDSERISNNNHENTLDLERISKNTDKNTDIAFDIYLDTLYSQFYNREITSRKDIFMQEFLEHKGILSNQSICFLEQTLNYKFRHPGILEKAMVHPSSNNNPFGSNMFNKLEFIGDSVIDLVVSQKVYENHELESPLHLHSARKALVNNFSLARMLFKLRITKYIHICFDQVHIRKMEMKLKKDGDSVNKLFADIFEAIFGAVFLDMELNFDTFNAYFLINFWEHLGQCSDDTR